jgi:RimJ/RimL family protein N-acetyltransferase/aryl carrier-like protein
VTATSAKGTVRDAFRARLSGELRLDIEVLRDEASLTADLGLDSLAMMILNTWLETCGVLMETDRLARARVGDVLDLLERRVPATVTVRDGEGTDPAALPASLGGNPAGPADPLLPVLADRAFRLTTVEPGDVPFLFRLATAPATGFRWRYRGAPPSWERFSSELWQQVLVHYVVRRTSSDEPVGYVVAYAADLGHGRAHVAAVFGADIGTGMPAQAVRMFVRSLFHVFPLRKIYFEIPGFNWPFVASAASTLFDVEGVLRDHDVYAGRYWDTYICAIHRDRVEQQAGSTDPASPPIQGEPSCP